MSDRKGKQSTRCVCFDICSLCRSLMFALTCSTRPTSSKGKIPLESIIKTRCVIWLNEVLEIYLFGCSMDYRSAQAREEDTT